MTGARYTSPHLCARERQILGMLAEGMTRVEVEKALMVAESTVKTHLRHAFRVMDARNIAHAVSLAYRRGILTMEPPS